MQISSLVPSMQCAPIKYAPKQAIQKTLPQIQGDSVRFGMFARKLEKATLRRDRVIINPHTNTEDKAEAQGYLEKMIDACKEPKKYHDKAKIGVKVGTGVVTGLTTLALGALGVESNPEDTQQAVEMGLLGIAGTAAGTTVGQSSATPIADALTDKKYPENHYPEKLTLRSHVYRYRFGYTKSPNYFDEDGNRYEIDKKALKAFHDLVDENCKFGIEIGNKALNKGLN